MKRSVYFYIPLNFGRRDRLGKLVMGVPGPWTVKEVIGQSTINLRGIRAGQKSTIVGI
jgi:hypothetical protein